MKDDKDTKQAEAEAVEPSGGLSCSVYIVHAERWGDIHDHCYICGWSKDINKAKQIADAEATFRGGKYAGVVYLVENKWRGKCKEVYRARSMAG